MMCSYLVSCCPISPHELSLMLAFRCKINKLLGKQLTKELFYYSRPVNVLAFHVDASSAVTKLSNMPTTLFSGLKSLKSSSRKCYAVK